VGIRVSGTVREYLMIYKGAGFLAFVVFGSSPILLSRQQVVSLSQSSCASPVELTDGRRGGGGGWGGAKSYDGEQAWSSVNHSMLFEHSVSSVYNHKKLLVSFSKEMSTS
jgi:hypothetical protein